jgi:hypothetical protein
VNANGGRAKGAHFRKFELFSIFLRLSFELS